MLGRGKGLAAHAFGDLLDFAAGLEESCDLGIDRIARFNGWSWFCFGVGCLDTHDCHNLHKLRTASHRTGNGGFLLAYLGLEWHQWTGSTRIETYHNALNWLFLMKSWGEARWRSKVSADHGN